MKSPEEYRGSAAFCAGLSAFLVVCGIVSCTLAVADTILYTIALQRGMEYDITVPTAIIGFVTLTAACIVRGYRVHFTLLHHEALHKDQNH